MVRALTIGLGGGAALAATWVLAVPALLVDAGSAPLTTIGAALAAALVPALVVAVRGARGPRPALLLETTVAAASAGMIAPWLLAFAAGAATAAAIDRAIASAGFALVLAPLFGLAAPAPVRPGPSPGQRALTTTLAATLVLGAWAVLGPAVLAQVAPPSRPAWIPLLGGLAIAATAASAMLAYLLARETARGLRHASLALAALDTPRASHELTPAAFDPELVEFAAWVERLGVVLHDEVHQFEATIAHARGADQAREEFLRVVSHELRTPLNAICGYAQLLLEGIDGPLSTDARDSVQAILDSGRQLSALVDDVVDLAMLSSGRPGLRPSPVDVGALAHEVMRALAPLGHGRPIELSVATAGELPEVVADRKRLRQVLVNLLSNALKFTDHGHVRLTLSASGRDRVAIAISDTGVGIPAHELAGIFDEYRQGTNLGRRRQKGAGLGLAICRRLVELHGGQIYAESNAGEGARFVVELPVAGPAATIPEGS
jgi:signal transduction histidine kinase